MKRIYPCDCSIDGCEKLAYRRDLCAMHYHRWRRHGDPTVKLPPGGGPKYGPEHPGWKGDDVGYGMVHQRLRTDRGKASEHVCSRCGARPGWEWAYTNDDPNQRLDPRSGYYYSPDPAFYVPMCASCHRLFDLARP